MVRFDGSNKQDPADEITGIVAVEDEVTGTGSLVHRLIFGVTDIDGRPAPMRDWELLGRLNDVPLKDVSEGPAYVTPAECAEAADRLRNAFESRLAEHAPTLRRPVCWPEMLLVPVNRRRRDDDGVARWALNGSSIDKQARRVDDDDEDDEGAARRGGSMAS